MNKVIGRVIISKDRPAKPSEFWFTIRNHCEEVEIGSYVVAEDDRHKIIGVVEDEDYFAMTESPSQYFTEEMATSMGSPPTSPTIIRIGKARVVAREPPLNIPPGDRWRVRFISSNDVQVLHKNIPENKRILAGFIRGGSWIPIYYHADFLLGPEAAHVNISGKTGLAVKTSYAVFLAYAVLSWAIKNKEPTAVVMFNVKRGDLMRLHKLPKDVDDAKAKIEQWAEKVGLSDKADIYKMLWNEAYNLGINPYNIRIKYFTYPTDQYQRLLEGADYQHYSYGLGDLTIGELIASLYRPEEEVPETQINLIYRYMDAARRRTNITLTFDNMLSHMDQYAKFSAREVFEAYRTPQNRRSRRQQHIVSVFHAPRLDNWHERVAGAVFRRLEGFLSRADHIVERSSPSGNPIKFSALEPYTIHVVQLYGLTDAEKRLVVNALLRELSDGLKEEATKESPRIKRILTLIDEMNLYAPRRASPIKEQIIDITARGRDLCHSLVGIQQFASQIDAQVYGNCSTKVVGNSDLVEVRSDIYRYLGKFRDLVPLLDKGMLITYHPTYTSPIPIIFPVPLYQVTL